LFILESDEDGLQITRHLDCLPNQVDIPSLMEIRKFLLDTKHINTSKLQEEHIILEEKMKKYSHISGLIRTDILYLEFKELNKKTILMTGSENAFFHYQFCVSD